jgi:hypothetical protein
VAAELSPGYPGRATLEDLKARAGAQTDPIFGALEALRTQFEMILAIGRSGKTLTEAEIQKLEKALPKDSEIQLIGGRLAPSAAARMRALENILHAEASSMIGARDPQVRRDLEGRFAALRERSMPEYRSILGLPAVPAAAVDPKVQNLLDQAASRGAR